MASFKRTAEDGGNVGRISHVCKTEDKRQKRRK